MTEQQDPRHAGKADMDHETTMEVDGVLVEQRGRIVEKDAGGFAHDVTEERAAEDLARRDEAAHAHGDEAVPDGHA
ncbi:hypothetical protein [Homoserinibacter sp. YIM 151385]|uniref:hypothetical protein n=1 Tax=Homoserinibacter sp. YIM 151385 TaxID=2985506 RepID=UPI0022F10FD6|nr:hypothetical protein [Homoserinibacter sp. YIM 151385]WBU38104.1 hypothetical protein OF852_00540 [Homoserinibacter sp. YIM 151385]